MAEALSACASARVLVVLDMWLAIRFWLGLAFAFTGICQAGSSIQFVPYAGPTVVYPDTDVNFALLADNGNISNYDFLAAPANAQITTIFEGGRSSVGPPSDNAGLINWHTPSRAAVGTTNVFTVRATSLDDPPLTATSMVSLVVIEVPPISSITLSNKIPVLAFTNAIPNSSQGYMIQWAAALPTTNWSLLTHVNSASTNIAVTDTNPPIPQRFYNLIPDGGWYYNPFTLPP